MQKIIFCMFYQFPHVFFNKLLTTHGETTRIVVDWLIRFEIYIKKMKTLDVQIEAFFIPVYFQRFVGERWQQLPLNHSHVSGCQSWKPEVYCQGGLHLLKSIVNTWMHKKNYFQCVIFQSWVYLSVAAEGSVYIYM